MSPNPNAWEFTASTREQLANVRQSLPDGAEPTVAGELFQIALLLEALVTSDLPEFPFTAHHTGENGVPDFQLVSGSRRIAVEMARVTTQNLEHAHSLQSKIPEPPLHFDATDLCYSEAFAHKLKASRDPWSKFVAARLSKECRAWLESWNGGDVVPAAMKEQLVAALNSVIDGPAIGRDPALERATLRPEFIRVEGIPCEETSRDRKSCLEDAFWEDLAVPIDPTLAINPFLRQNDSKMTHDEVTTTAFTVPALGLGGPDPAEEHQIWLSRVSSEIQDKSAKLASGDFRTGDEDWLVLWDRLGTSDWQLAKRAEAIAQHVAPLWKPGWFSRIFIQAAHFEWQLMLTEAEWSVLNRRGGPARLLRVGLPLTYHIRQARQAKTAGLAIEPAHG